MAASLPATSAQAITWQSYGSDASNLVSPQPLDFTTYSQYTFNPQGLFRQAGTVYATGLVIDNLLNSTPVIVTIGPIMETVPGYTKTTLQLGGTNAQVIINGTQSKLLATFFRGDYLGTTAGTNYYAAQIAAGLAVETGFVSMFAGSVASIPVGYLLCDGTAISRTTYAGLFSKIGTLYGVGDGSTTFNLPDLTSRVPIGAGTGTGLSTRALGSQGGAEQITITAQQMPVHTHGVNDAGHVHGVNDTGHVHTNTAFNFDGSQGVLNYSQFQIQDINAPSANFRQNNADSASARFPRLLGHPSLYDGSYSNSNYYLCKMNGATTGITLGAATTGITIGSAGGSGGTTQPVATVPPYTAMNFVIKT